MSKKDTYIIIIKYAKDFNTYYNCYNIKEYRSGNIEFVSFDKDTNSCFKKSTYHYVCRGRITTKINKIK